MKILKKIILAIALLSVIFTLCSCQKKMSKLLPYRPARDFDEDLKNASPEFKKGWEDGCETGMAGGSNTFYQMFYRNNAADGYLMTSSSDYKTAWGSAFWYCFRSDWVKMKSSIWGSTFGGYR